MRDLIKQIMLGFSPKKLHMIYPEFLIKQSFIKDIQSKSKNIQATPAAQFQKNQ